MTAMPRREYLGLLSIPALIKLTGGARAQTQPEPESFEPADTWVGPRGDRPDPDWVGFANATGTVAYLATDSGELSTIEVDTDEGWAETPTPLVGYANAALPTNVPTGTVFFDENRNLPAWWDTDHYEFPNFVDDVLTSPVTVADTTTRTTVFDPDINQNSLVKGRTYQVDLFGQFGTANNSDTFTVDINLGPATDVAGIGNVGGNTTGAPWSIEFTFTVREDGQNGTLQPHTRGLFNSDPADSHHSEVTVDTTTVTELSVDIEWSAADPDNTVTLGQAHLKQMG